MKRRMVLGFMFDYDRQVVAMIRKNRPDWQKGKLNGIGGKIEAGETPKQAMVREFKEETGIQHDEWEDRLVLAGQDWELHVFRAFSDHVHYVTTKTDETVFLVSLNHVDRFETIDNMKWVLPLVLDNGVMAGAVKYF